MSHELELRDMIGASMGRDTEREGERERERERETKKKREKINRHTYICINAPRCLYIYIYML